MISTASLILDITWVSEALFAQRTEDAATTDAGSIARAGRAGRAGTRVGRVIRIIRIIRLIRIVKLYRAYVERKKQAEQAAAEPGEKVESNVFQDNDEEEHEESRVGKKLSEYTTKKVIVLVLVMLLFIPQFNADGMAGKDTFYASSQYGVEEVYESYYNYLKQRVTDDPVNGLTTPTASLSAGAAELKDVYENNLLHNIYYHNPHVPRSADDNWEGTAHCHGCIATPRTAKNTMFFIGFLNLKELPPSMLSASMDPATTNTWDDLFRYPQFPMGTIPESSKELLSAPWDKNCVGPRDQFLGVSVAFPKTRRYMESEVNCPHDLRYEETEALPASSYIKSDKSDVPGISNFVFVFDQTEWVMQERGLNILQTFFIIIVLAGGAAMFSKDANTLVLGEFMIVFLKRTCP